MKRFYGPLNAFFHIFHLAVIVFILTGWAFRMTRPANLAVITATLASWYVLGRWLGSGYCPVTDLHWKIKNAAGAGHPDSYVKFCLDRICGRRLNAAGVDRLTLAVTVGCFLISAVLNILDLADSQVAWAKFVQ